MKPATALLPAAAALLLHGCLALIAASLLSPKDKAREPPRPIEVALIPEEPPAPPPLPAPPVPPAPSPVAPPAPAPAPSPPPPPPAAEKKRPSPKPRAERKPAPAQPPARPQTAAPAVQPEERPPPPAAVTAPPASAPATETPSAAAPPPRTPVSISASYAATNRKPEYPRLSRQLEEQGTVVLRVLVRADGTAGAVEIRTSSGSALLDQSARNAVQTWRFNPATQDGRPVDEWFLIPIPFKLQN